MVVSWSTLYTSCAITAVVHPFAYVKVLIQLGHEPMPPMVKSNLFFQSELQYPNAFDYMKHITKVDGLMGLYRGLLPRLWSCTATSVTYMAVSDVVCFKQKEDVELKEMCAQTSKEMVALCSAVVISHPFHVISVRCMAQFVGRETIYDAMADSVVQIYNDEGIKGFFQGLAPRLICETISLWISNLLVHAFNKLLFHKHSELNSYREHNKLLMNFVAHRLTYPLSVVSTIMAVNGTILAAGKPPFAPKYEDWISCLRDLRLKGASERGWDFFFRKAPKQTVKPFSTKSTPV